MEDPKTRFSDRAEDYARYRPGYPRGVLKFLEDRGAVTGASVVADVGSGTGSMSALFLESGNRVLAVEPNRQMRGAAERSLGAYPRFESVAGTAEDTTLADASVDLVVVANSLHWTDQDAARIEFSRVLKADGRVAVVWNLPRRSGTPFLEALGDLVSTYRTDDGAGGDAEDIHESTKRFFDGGPDGPQGYEMGDFPNSTSLDFEGLRGLMLSYSSMPAGSQLGSKEMLRDLGDVFRSNQSGGEVTVEYKASIYCGRLR